METGKHNARYKEDFYFLHIAANRSAHWQCIPSIWHLALYTIKIGHQTNLKKAES